MKIIESFKFILFSICFVLFYLSSFAFTKNKELIDSNFKSKTSNEDLNSNDYFSPPLGVVIYNSKAATGKYVGSPGITILPDGTYIATHDLFGEFISDTYVYKSIDFGVTWTRISTIKQLEWSKPFNIGNVLYLLGIAPKMNYGYGNVVILKSTDGGYTWTKPTDKKNGLLLDGYYHSAPTPVFEYNNKLWKGIEHVVSVTGYGDYATLVLSVNKNSDLLDFENWSFSNEIKFNKSSLNGATNWLEGNIVLDKQNQLKNILRLNYNPDNLVAVQDLSEDGLNLNFNVSNGFKSFYGGGKKFTIKFDSVSDKYWTLCNYVRPADYGNTNGSVRNTVVLAWSSNLSTWNIKDTLLYHPDVKYHGFQYLDWQIEGTDIIAVSRTAWEDSTGQANSQHDANYLTFHRFLNFRYISNVITVDSFNYIRLIVNQQSQSIQINIIQPFNGIIKLFDISGKICYKCDVDINQTDITIDTSSFNRGIYILQVLNKSNNQVEKIVLDTLK